MPPTYCAEDIAGAACPAIPPMTKKATMNTTTAVILLATTAPPNFSVRDVEGIDLSSA
jgi:hypothetical protein